MARILSILAKAGLITLKDGVDELTATKEDIVDNPHNYDFSIEVNPEQLTNTLDDDQADLVAINGNYAIAAGLKPSTDALLLELIPRTRMSTFWLPVRISRMIPASRALASAEVR